MGLWVHRAERADRLATGLGGLLSNGLADPFATEIVAVPTRGVERWLAQTLSHVLGAGSTGDGVCAGIDFPSPERMIGDALAGITGIESWTDPWHPRQAVWALLSVIDNARGEPWAAPLWRYLDRSQPVPDQFGRVQTAVEASAAENSAGRRYGTARHLCDLMAGYAANRPQMIENWLTGRDVDGDGRPLPEEMAWQAELWRRLRTELDLPSPAERLRTACQQLINNPGRSTLPQRLSVFGPTRLPYATLAVLAALARHRDVHLWVPHASPALWTSIARSLTGTDLIARALPESDVLPAPTGSRSADTTVDLVRHRLLGYLGRDSRELQLGLARLPAEIHDRHLDPDDHLIGARSSGDHHGSLLARLQHDLADDVALGTAAPEPIAADDDSIAVHAAHGPDRQVEVLREVLLGLLEADPSLEPRDIVVMCPDIETFAPLISAAFGAQAEEADDEVPAGHPGHRLRVRLADRSLRQLNPLLQVLGQLFDLAESRIEASAILDLCATDPVATRFDFSADDILRLRELVARSGVRWGFDAVHRQQFGMGEFAQNTWAAGLDRMLLGVAMDEDGQHFLGTTLPMDDIDAGDADLVGRLTEMVGRLSTVITAFDRRQTLRSWIAVCREALDLLTSVRPTDNWQLGQAYGELARIAESAAGGSTGPGGSASTGSALSGRRDDVELTRREIRGVLAELFAGRPSRANFRTGTLTVATLLPMRSVPHRVVCLLGLDDGVFPRGRRLDGDDLLAVDPWIGDRDRRSEDRQLLLDAVMSAEQHLVIIYSGADPRTNAFRPPSVPLGELMDVLDQTATAADGGPVRGQILQRHPLQPFDKINFDGRLRPPDAAGAPFSFDPDGLAGARAVLADRSEPEPIFSDAELPPFQLPSVIQLADLINFFRHPVRAYLRSRAGFVPFSTEDVDEEDIPISVEGLGAWAVGDRMLRRHLTGVTIEQLVGAEWRRGGVPPKAMGARALNPIANSVAEIAERARPLQDGDQRTVDVLAELEIPGPTPQSITLVGTVPGVYGRRAVTVQYSKLGAQHRLAAWIRLLAMTATDPQPWQACTVAQSGFGGDVSTMGPVPAEFAAKVLADLVDLYRSGLSAPLPLPPKTAADYAERRRDDRAIDIVLPRIRRTFQMESDDLYQAVFGITSLDQLLTMPSVRDEERGSLAEPSRFGTLARRVWHPLLGAEVIDA
jgi:exodeoxyribonuclease V gamma subunit